MNTIDLLALDADDTLWHNETLYRATRDRFVELLAATADEQTIIDRLDETEGHNLESFGFGIKAYTLSLIETAVSLTGGKISGHEVQQIVNLAHEMIDAPVKLLPGVAETLPRLAEQQRLLLLTKGDILDQERKLERSHLAQYFTFVEVTSKKNLATYRQVLQQYQVTPEHFMMVGNSLKSDILPVLELKASAVYIPFEITWLHETAEPPAAGTIGFYELASFAGLPGLLDHLTA
jgi:putative hydrolase of the HAD superfamily